MKATNINDKHARLKQFLQRLSEDKDVSGGVEMPSRSLSEFLLLAGYTPNGESVDIAKLVTMLLSVKGIEGCSEQLMEYVLNGGSIEGFLNKL